MIKVENLKKVYRVGSEKVAALGGVDFEVKKGEICCLLGVSGSGKSTLLNLMAGLERPSRGRVIVRGQVMGQMSERGLAEFRMNHFGFVFQAYNLLPALTAIENVAMPMMFQGHSQKKRERAASAMLDAVGLSDRKKHRPTQMSGGQQQRVGIARAFVTAPDIVFADEPTGNLDSRTTEEVIKMIIRLTRDNGKTLVVVTHNSEIASYADHIIQLRDGKIVSEKKNESENPV